MKNDVRVLCPRCERLAELTTFRMEGATLVVTCVGCGEASRVEAAVQAPAQVAAPMLSRPVSQPPRVSLASTDGGSNVVVLRTAGHEAIAKAARAADDAPFAVPDNLCPRCIAPRASAKECPHCGISFEKYEESMTMPPRWLRDAWLELLRDWGNEAKHQQVRRKAQQLDGLAAVGRLYRLRLASVPDDPFAAEGRADIVRLASVQMNFTPAAAGDDPVLRRRRNVVLGLGGFGGLVLVLWVLRMFLR